MKYMHVSLSGLNGKRHPALNNLISSHEVKKSRIHLKILAGDYLTYEVKSNQSGGSPSCRSCDPPSPIENMTHILTTCETYCDIKQRIMPELEELCSQSKSNVDFLQVKNDSEILCQFILDPASFNLKQRIHVNDPLLEEFYRFSRDHCYSINSRRMKILKSKQNGEEK